MKSIWEGIVPQDMIDLYREVGLGRRMGFGKAPAILVIDMIYNSVGFVPENVSESIKKVPFSCGDLGWAAVPNTKELIKAARQKRVPVMYTRLQQESFDRGVWRPKMSPRLADSAIAKGGQKGTDIIKEIAPQEGEIVITKKRTSSFFGTALTSYLNKYRVDTLIIAGGATSSCVHTTVVDANQYNYHVVVVQECVFDRHPFIHAVSLFDLDSKWCDVVSLNEIKKYFDSLT